MMWLHHSIHSKESAVNISCTTMMAVFLATAMSPALPADPPNPVLLIGHKRLVTTLASAGEDRTIRVKDPAKG